MSMRGLAVVPAVALSIVAGCVELTGQRFSWFHDEAADELRILIFYDGIHDSGSDENGKGTEQVPEFVANGDVMIADWFLHLEMDELRDTAEDAEASPAERQAARLATSLRTEPIGYYREPGGRVGAVQRVTIPRVSQFVRDLNRTISATVLEADDDAEMPRTLKRMQEAAQGGHEWVTLEGHAVRFEMPVHPDEWAHNKAEFLAGVFTYAAEAPEEDDADARWLVQALTSAAVSYVDEGDRVTFVLGARASPGTLRLGIRKAYEPSLERVVAETLKVDLDQALAEEPGGGGAANPAALLDIVRWGPPEERVRALVWAASGDQAQRAEAAIKRLEAFAESWNVDHGMPEAPPSMQDAAGYISAWNRFYEALKQYPIGAPGPD